MKDLCQKMEGKTNFSRRLKQFSWLCMTDPDRSHFTTDLRHCLATQTPPHTIAKFQISRLVMSRP